MGRHTAAPVRALRRNQHVERCWIDPKAANVMLSDVVKRRSALSQRRCTRRLWPRYAAERSCRPKLKSRQARKEQCSFAHRTSVASRLQSLHAHASRTMAAATIRSTNRSGVNGSEERTRPSTGSSPRPPPCTGLSPSHPNLVHTPSRP